MQLPGCQPPHIGKGQAGLIHLCRNMGTHPVSPCLDFPQHATYIHPRRREKKAPSARRAENKEGQATPEPADRWSHPALRKSLRVPSHLRWARGSSCPLPEVSALQACGGRGGGAAQPPPEQGARAERSWPPRGRRQRHREGLVGGFPMHPEAVDAGVLGVAPVSQDPQLHHLVRGHFRALGREGRGGSAQTRGETATPRARRPLPRASVENRTSKLLSSDPGTQFPPGGPRSPTGFTGPTGATNACQAAPGPAHGHIKTAL